MKDYKKIGESLAKLNRESVVAMSLCDLFAAGYEFKKGDKRNRKNSNSLIEFKAGEVQKKKALKKKTVSKPDPKV